MCIRDRLSIVTVLYNFGLSALGKTIALAMGPFVSKRALHQNAFCFQMSLSLRLGKERGPTQAQEEALPGQHSSSSGAVSSVPRFTKALSSKLLENLIEKSTEISLENSVDFFDRQIGSVQSTRHKPLFLKNAEIIIKRNEKNIFRKNERMKNMPKHVTQINTEKMYIS